MTLILTAMDKGPGFVMTYIERIHSLAVEVKCC